jgi:two-component system, OmpR family, alkaline phosphatase synthesis response regulator PhoP
VSTAGTRWRRLLDRLVGRAPTNPPAAATRVLVVDDDAVIRALITVTLSVEGFEMFGAADARLALEMLSSIQPHLVILDSSLPESGADDICRQLHADAGSAQVKLLLLTKPFEPHELVADVHKLLT